MHSDAGAARWIVQSNHRTSSGVQKCANECENNSICAQDRASGVRRQSVHFLGEILRRNPYHESFIEEQWTAGVQKAQAELDAFMASDPSLLAKFSTRVIVLVQKYNAKRVTFSRRPTSGLRSLVWTCVSFRRSALSKVTKSPIFISL
jgi:hypothetical protein